MHHVQQAYSAVYLALLQDGDVQLWGIQAGAFLDSLSCADDIITAAEAMQDEPYVLLGYASGSVQACMQSQQPCEHAIPF